MNSCTVFSFQQNQPSTTLSAKLTPSDVHTYPLQMNPALSPNKQTIRKAFYRQRSEAKLRQVLGPVSFSLSDDKKHKKSTMSKEPSESKLRKILGPVSFNLKNKRQIKVYGRNCLITIMTWNTFSSYAHPNVIHNTCTLNNQQQSIATTPNNGEYHLEQNGKYSFQMQQISQPKIIH